MQLCQACGLAVDSGVDLEVLSPSSPGGRLRLFACCEAHLSRVEARVWAHALTELERGLLDHTPAEQASREVIALVLFAAGASAGVTPGLVALGALQRWLTLPHLAARVRPALAAAGLTDGGAGAAPTGWEEARRVVRVLIADYEPTSPVEMLCASGVPAALG